MRRLLCCFASALCLWNVSPGGAQSADAGRSYVLKLVYRQGDMTAYAVNTSMKMRMTAEKQGTNLPDNSDFSMAMVSRSLVTGVRSDGKYRVRSTIVSGTVRAMGMEMPVPKTLPTTMVVDQRGRASSVQGPAMTGADLTQMMNMGNLPSLGVLLPDHPVRAGDTWSENLPAPMGKGQMRYDCALLGEERVGGVETVKVKQVVTMPIEMHINEKGAPTTDPDAPLTMTGEVVINQAFNLRPTTGWVEKGIGSLRLSISLRVQGKQAESSPFGKSLSIDGNGTVAMRLRPSAVRQGRSATGRPRPSSHRRSR